MVAPIHHPDGSYTLEYLPSEIITEILLYLPVKSLLKFRCVCKTWRSEISSSKFTNTHLNRSKDSEKYSNHSLILQSLEHSNNIYTCSLTSMLDSTTLFQPKALYHPPSSSQPAKSLFIYGHCNGLLCVEGDNSTLVLYNPATQKLKRLPNSGFERYPRKTCGLCYHELDDDYRVVQLHTTRITEDGVRGVNIYSLRTNSWRRINDCKGYTILLPGLPVGGLLHWSIYNGLCQILVVDTEKYTHVILAGPKYDNKTRDRYWGVMEFGGCLGAYQVYFQTGVDFWTMKESSWSKVLSLNYYGADPFRTSPLAGLKNGQVIFINEPQYSMVYKSGENTLTTKAIPNFKVPAFVGSLIYIESLVAPSFDGE